jgi:hypothetical protein
MPSPRQPRGFSQSSLVNYELEQALQQEKKRQEEFKSETQSLAELTRQGDQIRQVLSKVGLVVGGLAFLVLSGIMLYEPSVRGLYLFFLFSLGVGFWFYRNRREGS